jgi:hypothetical protein
MKKMLVKKTAKEMSAPFTHINLSTGRRCVKPPISYKKELTYKCVEVQSLKIKVEDMRGVMAQEPNIRKNLLKKQMIVQTIYLN